MLRLLKRKCLSIAIDAHSCYWVTCCGQHGNWPIGLIDPDWPSQLHQAVKKIGYHDRRVILSFDAMRCRFATLPAQFDWLTVDQLYRAQRYLFEQQYPDYDLSHVVVSDPLVFGQATLLVSLPKPLFLELRQITALLNIHSALPTPIQVWNFLGAKNDHSPMYLKFPQRLYVATVAKNRLIGLQILPIQLLSEQAEHLFDLAQIDVLPSAKYNLTKELGVLPVIAQMGLPCHAPV